jgi:hypothetical protein
MKTPRPNDRITDRLPEFAARFRDHQAAQDAIAASYTPPGYWRPIEEARRQKMHDLAAFKAALVDIAGAAGLGAAGWAILHILFSI